MLSNIPVILYLVVLVFGVQWLSLYFARLVNQLPLLRYLLFPGIFLHEFAHYITALLTGAKVSEFKVGFHEGHVVHGKPKIPLIGMMLVTLAPLISGIVILIFTFQWVTGISIQELSEDIPLSLSSLINFVNSIHFLSFKFLIALYIFINVLATFAPSKQDFKNSIIPILLYVIASFFLRQLDGFNLYVVNVLVIVAGVLVISIVILKGVVTVLRRT